METAELHPMMFLSEKVAWVSCRRKAERCSFSSVGGDVERMWAGPASHVFPRPHRRGRKLLFCQNTEGVRWFLGAVGKFDSPKLVEVSEKDAFWFNATTKKWLNVGEKTTSDKQRLEKCRHSGVPPPTQSSLAQSAAFRFLWTHPELSPHTSRLQNPVTLRHLSTFLLAKLLLCCGQHVESRTDQTKPSSFSSGLNQGLLNQSRRTRSQLGFLSD